MYSSSDMSAANIFPVCGMSVDLSVFFVGQYFFFFFDEAQFILFYIGAIFFFFFG